MRKGLGSTVAWAAAAALAAAGCDAAGDHGMGVKEGASATGMTGSGGGACEGADGDHMGSMEHAGMGGTMGGMMGGGSGTCSHHTGGGEPDSGTPTPEPEGQQPPEDPGGPTDDEGAPAADGGMMGDGDHMGGGMMGDGDHMGGGMMGGEGASDGCPMMGGGDGEAAPEDAQAPEGCVLLAPTDGQSLVQEQAGTKVTAGLVAPVLGGATWIDVTLAAENHSASLAAFSPALDAELSVDGAPVPGGPLWIPGPQDGAMGGHHLDGTLRFTALADGPALIGCDAGSLTLSLSNLGGAAWTFTWPLAAPTAP